MKSIPDMGTEGAKALRWETVRRLMWVGQRERATGAEGREVR